MQFPWLEKLAAEGKISTQARDEIYRDCSFLLKHSSEVMSERMFKFREAAGDIAGNAAMKGSHEVGTRLLEAGRAIVDKRVAELVSGRLEVRALIPKIVENRKRLATDPDFSANPNKAEARFDEVCKIAPHVAANWELVRRLVKDRLQSGFTTNDITTLALIQAQHSTSTGALTKALEKKASAARLGEMYADVLLICHEAGVTKTAASPRTMPQVKGDTLKRVLTQTLAMSAVPILTGVGVGAVNQMKAWRDGVNQKAKLEAAFNAATKGSDVELLTQNPEKARQAFQTLAHFAPHVAMEANAARSFMKKLVAYDVGVQVGDIKDLSEIQKNMLGRGGPSPFFKGLASGVDAMGLRDVVKGGISTVSGPLGQELERQVDVDIAKWRESQGALDKSAQPSRFSGLRGEA